MEKIKVAVNGYGVIGKRVTDAVQMQEDMELSGVCDVVTDWRIQMAVLKKYPVFASDDTFCYRKSLITKFSPKRAVCMFSPTRKRAIVTVKVHHTEWDSILLKHRSPSITFFG